MAIRRNNFLKALELKKLVNRSDLILGQNKLMTNENSGKRNKNSLFKTE